MSNLSKYFLAKSQRSRRRGLELMNFVVLMFVIATSMLTIATLGQLRIYAEEIPTEDRIRQDLQNRGENSRIYDRNGTLLYTFKDPDRDREYADFEEFPRTLIAAALAAEDKDFFVHEGIDYIGMVRGVLNSISSSGENLQGGSTITQQLVKQTILTNEQTVDRKIKEAIISLMVERDYSKDQILEYYLNVVNLGGRVMGMKTGAKVYFNKSLDKLDLNEAAFLISLVQSPGEYSPLFANDKELALKLVMERKANVLVTIANSPRILNYLNTGNKNHLFDQELPDTILQLEKPKYTPENVKKLLDKKFKFTQPVDNLKAPHWVFYIRDLLSKAPYNLSIQQLYSGGYEIHTSLDLRVQELAERKLKEGVDRYGPRFGFQNGALITLDPRSGEILAMVGSKGYNLPSDPNNRKFDPKTNVTTSIRQLGSTLKPFVSYLGFESGKYTPSSVVKDSPQTFYRFYRPKNVDGRFFGDMTVRKALLDSRNLPFLKMLYSIGDWKLGELMEKIGYNKSNDYGLAAAVGGVNETLLSHTHAYAGLANEGTIPELRPVLKIQNRDGSNYFTAEAKVYFQLNSRSVAMVSDILGDKSYTPGNYRSKFIGAQKLAGKTGTSDGNKNTFYMGYGPKVVTGLWCGNNDNSPMSSAALGSSTALLIWNGYMREFFQQFPQYGENGSY
jgi:penicillin-binding protein 1A